MQVTVDLPEDLAEFLGSHPEQAGELLQAGARLRNWVGESKLANEVIAFLAAGPSPDSIVAFHPSEAASARVTDLLARNRQGVLTAAEKAELDETALLDHFVTLLKARAYEQANAA